jgi:putative photosynthetic complex assembly protein
MSEASAHQDVPRIPLLAAAILVLVSLAAAATARLTGFDTRQVPPSAAVVARDLRFEDRPDGSVAVLDARTGATVDRLAPGADNFIRGTLRSLARARRMHGVTTDPPFRLSARADGRLTLEDPATGTEIGLEAFGVTNAGAFARFLTPRQVAQGSS